MKYIKEYNHEFYHEINREQYEKLIYKSPDFIPKEYHEKIISISKQLNPEFRDLSTIGYGKFAGKYREIYLLSYNGDISTKRTIQISLQTDEWFLCKINNIKYYKCDQMEGLFKFLKDYII